MSFIIVFRGLIMDSHEIFSEILLGIDKALDLEYNQLYINVDQLEGSMGFLRVLAMKGLKDIIVFEGSFEIGICYKVLDLLQESEYDITDFTTRWED